MSNRTWACIDCGKTYSRPWGVEYVPCAICRRQCQSVHWKIRVPSPKNRKIWTRFWITYLEEKRALARYHASGRRETVRLELLNMVLHAAERVEKRKLNQSK